MDARARSDPTPKLASPISALGHRALRATEIVQIVMTHKRLPVGVLNSFKLELGLSIELATIGDGIID